MYEGSPDLCSLWAADTKETLDKYNTQLKVDIHVN